MPKRNPFWESALRYIWLNTAFFEGSHRVQPDCLLNREPTIQDGWFRQQRVVVIRKSTMSMKHIVLCCGRLWFAACSSIRGDNF